MRGTDILEGYIYSVETFGTVDGPGIRFVVFMQGCPLQCKYCHNRDTWELFKGKRVTIGELTREVAQYQDYYRNSGGGVTASGGEPTLQAEFVTEFFRRVKEMDLNTALDTSGFVRIENVKELLDQTDLVILDIKQTDTTAHRNLTGVGNDKIIDFAHFLAEIRKPVWIRQVLIPGINTDERQLDGLYELLKEMPNIERVELLGYHKLGAHKWALAGCADPLNDVPAANDQQVEKAKLYLRSRGIENVR